MVAAISPSAIRSETGLAGLHIAIIYYEHLFNGASTGKGKHRPEHLNGPN